MSGDLEDMIPNNPRCGPVRQSSNISGQKYEELKTKVETLEKKVDIIWDTLKIPDQKIK